MRNILVFALLVGLAIGCGSDPPAQGVAQKIGATSSAIIGGDLDPGDPSVIELLYIVGLTPSDCDGGAACLQSCLDATTGQPCTSGATCRCGVSAGCTGELIGPHSVVTAGHCTDLTTGGTLSGPGGPTLTLCTSEADTKMLASGTAPSSGCNIAAFALFNNRCTTTNSMGSCEATLIQYGDYIVADQLVNPDYERNAVPPYTATNNDNDIGLVHLTSTTLVNGGPEPDLLRFNRADLGTECTDLGGLKSVGYGITQPSQGSMALAGLKYEVTTDAKVKDAWHIEEDGAQAYPSQTCGPGTGEEPTCEGDSGGPSFDSNGFIVGITSLGDPNCTAYGESVRIDAYASWLDSTMAGWGDPANGTVVPVDSGSLSDSPAFDDATPIGPEASATVVEAEASAIEAEGGADRSAIQSGGSSSGSSGCAVGAASPDGRRAGGLALLLTLATALARRRALRRR
jgi:hypothetical protein